MPPRLHAATALSAILALLACGSESEDGADATSGPGGGGAAATSSGRGGSAGDGGVPTCMSCAEVMSSSAPRPICPGPSTEVLLKLTACTCTACAAPCVDPCNGGMLVTDECTSCKIQAWSGACVAQYDACAGDV